MKHNYKVGDGVTVHRYSDAHAYTVIAVTDCTIKIQRDKATLLNGYNSGEVDALHFSPGGFFGHTSGTQRYSYERDLTGTVAIARLQKKPYQRWTKGAVFSVPEAAFKAEGCRVFPGRSEHYDFNF